jgi:hypothetical protein
MKKKVVNSNRKYKKMKNKQKNNKETLFKKLNKSLSKAPNNPKDQAKFLPHLHHNNPQMTNYNGCQTPINIPQHIS